METQINIAEILKGCPKGMELDCLIYENVTLVQVKEGYDYPIVIETPNGQMLLSKYGGFSKNELAKCIIFPKGETTWEGFQRPFMDGDILISGLEGCEGNSFIFKQINSVGNAECYCAICDGELIFNSDNWTPIRGCRLATPKEKEKLFDTIKANGYKWNTETKTLKNVIEPKFKVGDKIRHKINNDIYEISAVYDGFYGLVDYAFMLNMKYQDDYKLVQNKFDITTLKPFDKVLVRDKDTDEWIAHLFSHYYKNSDRPYICIGAEGINEYKQCIPYEENKHLLGNSNDCNEQFKTW